MLLGEKGADLRKDSTFKLEKLKLFVARSTLVRMLLLVLTLLLLPIMLVLVLRLLTAAPQTAAAAQTSLTLAYRTSFKSCTSSSRRRAKICCRHARTHTQIYGSLLCIP